MTPENRIQTLETEVNRKPWRPEIIGVAALLLLITALGWLKVQAFSDQLRDGAVASCKTNNVLRAATRDHLTLQIQITRELIPPSIYPPTGPLSRLRVIESRRQIRRALALVDCENRYP